MNLLWTPRNLASRGEILYCNPKGRRALLRVPSTVGRSVCLWWEHSKPKGPTGALRAQIPTSCASVLLGELKDVSSQFTCTEVGVGAFSWARFPYTVLRVSRLVSLHILFTACAHRPPHRDQIPAESALGLVNCLLLVDVPVHRGSLMKTHPLLGPS